MADPILEFDPTAEASGSPLTITTGNFGFVSFTYPSPPAKAQWASSVDTEGSSVVSSGHENRTITVGLEVSTDASLAILQSKLAKLHREGGTLKYTTTAGVAGVFDVLIQDGYEPQFDHMYLLGAVAQVQFSLTCKPYIRTAEVDLGDNVETTLPALVFTEATVAGDVPALGRLVIDDDSGVSQWWLTWGVQSRYYDSATSAALFYEAEGRTPLSGAAIATGPAGASGGGANNVIQHTSLSSVYQSILSTQAASAGAHLSHIGTFRVYARVNTPSTNANDVTVALEWSEGDFLRWTRNDETLLPWTTVTWRLVDLGLVTLTKAVAGTQRWEGRVIAKANTAGDDIALDHVFLIPVSEGSGVVEGLVREFTPTAYVAVDEFTGTTSGVALNGRTPATGAAWATSGAATDLAFVDSGTPTGNTSEAVSRSVATGVATPRYGVFGPTTSALEYRARMGLATGTIGGSGPGGGQLARWVDASNHLRFGVNVQSSSLAVVTLTKLVAGTATTIAPLTYNLPLSANLAWPGIVDLVLRVEKNGYVRGRVYNTAGTLLLTLEATDADLGTGGTLDDGTQGIFDFGDGTNVLGRWYDNLSVAVPPTDAATFASQSIEIRSDRVVREDSGGTLWVKPSTYVGDYLLVPPSAAEARTSRVIVKATRADPSSLDPSIDDISAKLFVTPRYLAMPS